jgi:hypothetical protein
LSLSSDIFVDRIDVFFGGLKAKECHSKNVISYGPLLDGVCFSFFHWRSAYIRRFCFVVPLFPAYVRLVQKPVNNNNNIFAV